MTILKEPQDTRLRRLAEQLETPLYVYDGDVIEDRYRLLTSCLPTGFEVFYSVKCNPLLGVCQLLRQLGSSVEVASAGELLVALEAGFQPQDIIWTSPGKTQRELTMAVDHGIYSINVESVEEARLIGSLAIERGTVVQVSARINPDFQPAGAGLKMTGVPSPFGIDQSLAVDALTEIAAMPGLSFIGLHVFTGSQVLDAGVLVRTMEKIIQLALELSAASGLSLQFLDLGGGFGIPYFPGEQAFDANQLRLELGELWYRFKDRLSGMRIGVESGRFLLAESGVFLAKVLYVKSCKGTKFVVCDGGSNQHASSAFLGRYVRNNFPMRLLDKGELETEEVNVVGPLCTPTDVIGQKVHLAPPESGDLLVVERSGAYGLTHSPVLFLSHPLPVEVLCYQGEELVLRERGIAENFLRGQQSFQQKEVERAIHV
ncbi:MAG: type III PLP-dependent enzyme [Gorillibacterium sp.]|nr:type III PLP-dependent enzyme [Gorillibacterium sp.]